MKLLAPAGFASANIGGKTYVPETDGTIDVPDGDEAEGIINSLRSHGFVDAPAPAAGADTGDGGGGAPAEKAIADMTKAELAEYAKTKFNVDLDPTKMNRDALLAEVQKLVDAAAAPTT